MVEVTKIMATPFKSALTAALSSPNPVAGHSRPLPMPETPGHSWASLGHSFVESPLLSPVSWCTQGFVFALQESVSPVLCEFWCLCGGANGNFLQEGLCHTQVCCTQSHCPSCRPLLIHISTGDTHTQIWLGLCGISGPWCAQGLFEPSECLCWVWGLILNMISPLLSSFCGFSIALGCGVSFFGDIQHSPVNGYSAVSCYFGVLTGEDELTSFYSTILQTQPQKIRDSSHFPLSSAFPTQKLHLP